MSEETIYGTCFMCGGPLLDIEDTDDGLCPDCREGRDNNYEATDGSEGGG